MAARLVGTEFQCMHWIRPSVREAIARRELEEARIPAYTGEVSQDWLKSPDVEAIGSLGPWAFARMADYWDARGYPGVGAACADQAARIVTGLVPVERSATGVTRFVLRTDAALCWLAKHLIEQNHRSLS